jgi:hypothetical protein
MTWLYELSTAPTGYLDATPRAWFLVCCHPLGERTHEPRHDSRGPCVPAEAGNCRTSELDPRTGSPRASVLGARTASRRYCYDRHRRLARCRATDARTQRTPSGHRGAWRPYRFAGRVRDIASAHRQDHPHCPRNVRLGVGFGCWRSIKSLPPAPSTRSATLGDGRRGRDSLLSGANLARARLRAPGFFQPKRQKPRGHALAVAFRGSSQAFLLFDGTS